jgi:capsular polysaccharide biosynthesis protein
MTDSGKNTDFDSTNLIFFFYRWRKPLLLIGGVAFIVSTIVSFLIPERYKSTVIMFPATTSSLSKALLSENPSAKQDVLLFGQEEEAEQMLQILNSDEIRDRICKRFKLMQHYHIDTTDRYKRTRLYDEYQSNITFKRTEFMSVKIEVLDINPDTAARIANVVAQLLDSTTTRMQRERASQAFRIVKNEYLDKLKDVKFIGDSMNKLNEKGMYDYESQSSVVSEQYAIAIAKGDERAIKSLEQKLKVISEYGSAYLSVRDNLTLQTKQLNMLKTKFEEAKVDAEQEIPHKFIVNNAFPAEKKSSPVRWIIVAGSTLSAILIAVICIIILDSLNRYRKTEKGEPVR